MINTKYDPAPWTDDLTPLIEKGDGRVLLNGKPLRTACRIIAEENFQYAMARVNAHDDLLSELKDILGWALEEKAPLRAQEIAHIRATIAKAESTP